jgi:chromosome segregation ATPase
MQNDVSSIKEENNNLSLKIIQNDISDLLENIGKIEESFDKYKKNDMPVLKEAVSYIINKIDDIGEDAKTTYADDFTALNNSIDVVKGQITSLVNEVTLLNGAINKFNVGMNSSNNEFSSIGYEINDINKTLSDTAEEMKNLKQDMGTLVSQVNDLESLHDNVSEIKSSLTGVMVQLNTALTPDIDSLNARIDLLTEKNNSHLTELESLMHEKINQQERQIAHLEEKMDDLTNKFEKLIAVMSEENKNYEVKDILNYLVTQVAAANEGITNQQNANKVLDTVAEKLSSFDNNINKIVSYIEED